MPKIVDSEDYRKELLSKCFDLLADKGYANVTTRQLAKELGISTGAMYHYFPSKKALFEQLVDELGQQDILQLKQVLEQGDTVKERLQLLGEFLITHEEYFVKQTAIWTDFCLQADAGEISSNQVLNRVDELYCEAIAEAFHLQEPKIARFIWTLINGILIEQLGGSTYSIFSEQVHLLIQMLTAYFEQDQG